MARRWEEANGFNESSRLARLMHSRVGEDIGFLIEEQNRDGFQMTTFRAADGSTVAIEKFTRLGDALRSAEAHRTDD